MMKTDSDNLVKKMEDARARLNAAVDKVAPQVEIYPSWKLKQLLDHIAGWDELVIKTLQAYSTGSTPELAVKNGINRYNAESIHARQALSLEQSRQAYHTLREQVIQAIRAMPAEKLTQRYPAPWGGTCTVPSIVKIFVSHEKEHAERIEEVLNTDAS